MHPLEQCRAGWPIAEIEVGDECVWVLSLDGFPRLFDGCGGDDVEALRFEASSHERDGERFIVSDDDAEHRRGDLFGCHCFPQVSSASLTEVRSSVVVNGFERKCLTPECAA